MLYQKSMTAIWGFLEIANNYLSTVTKDKISSIVSTGKGAVLLLEVPVQEFTLFWSEIILDFNLL